MTLQNQLLYSKVKYSITMIYQLAKTTPLLSGQVKMNLILNNGIIDKLTYTPISKYIKFNYSNPVDVLNYSHLENIKMLYEKIADVFYKPITNPKLSTQHLYKFKDTIDDTHENTYEMGMKRCEYKRYKKQFEFFTPIWCDTKKELENIRFEICFVNPKSNKTIFKKFIGYTDEIKKYINACWISEKAKDDDLIYIDFKKYESYIQGINVEKGVFETKDASYILKTLTEQERPVLETDNLICNLFSANKLIAPQIFNFNIVFGLEDVLPFSMLNDFIAEDCNIFINIYVGNTIVKVKDFYSNYENIPRYNIQTGKYNASSNVLDYMKDYKSTQLVDKNKLVQSTIHWALRENTESLFNLYNGFAPTYLDYIGSKITCNEPDMFANAYDPLKNPFGIFKYTDLSSFGSNPNEFNKYFYNDDNFFEFIYKTDTQKEIEKFGSVFINTSKIDIKNINLLNETISGDTDNTQQKLQFGIARINKNLGLSAIADYIMGSYTQYGGVETTQLYTGNEDNFDIQSKSYKVGSKIIGRVNLLKVHNVGSELLWIETFIYDNQTVIGRKISIFVNSFEDEICTKLLTFEKLSTYKQFSSANNNPFINSLHYLQYFLEAIEKQQKIVLENSVTQKIATAPNVYANEIEFNKTENNIELYRYCSNLLPMFIDTNIDSTVYTTQQWKNNVYWVKQYDVIEDFLPEKTGFEIRIKNKNALYKDMNIKETQEEHFSNDPDGISDYISVQTTKFSPVYPSIGFFPLNTYKNIDYTNFYPFSYYDIKTYKNLNKKYIYTKEFSWYKNNNLIYLPEEFEDYVVIAANTNVQWNDIKKILVKHLNDKYKLSDDEALKEIFSKYICKYKTDYLSVEDIYQQKVEIKFILR